MFLNEYKPIHKKQQIRKDFLGKRLNSTQKNLENSSKVIRKTLEGLPEFKKATKILFYVPIKNEVNILPLIEKSLKNKKVFLPKSHKDRKIFIHQIESLEDLEPGMFKVPEPNSNCTMGKAADLDLIIVPGVAFDKKGLRIGYGKGYYDRFLKKTKCPKIALAYEFQIHENIPGEIHDEKVDMIVTEKNLLTN